MIAADDNRRFELSRLDQVVHPLAEFSAFAVPQPADAGGQSLEADLLPRELDPAAQNFVIGEQLEDEIVGYGDIVRIARKRSPAERSAAFAKHRPDVRG